MILLGSYIDSVSQADPVFMTRLMKGLDEFLERDQDRALFDLAATAQRRLTPPHRWSSWACCLAGRDLPALRASEPQRAGGVTRRAGAEAGGGYPG